MRARSNFLGPAENPGRREAGAGFGAESGGAPDGSLWPEPPPAALAPGDAVPPAPVPLGFPLDPDVDGGTDIAAVPLLEGEPVPAVRLVDARGCRRLEIKVPSRVIGLGDVGDEWDEVDGVDPLETDCACDSIASSGACAEALRRLREGSLAVSSTCCSGAFTDAMRSEPANTQNSPKTAENTTATLIDFTRHPRLLW